MKRQGDQPHPRPSAMPPAGEAKVVAAAGAAMPADATTPMSDVTTITPPPAPPHDGPPAVGPKRSRRGKWGRRIALLYFVLLIASMLSQALLWPGFGSREAAMPDEPSGAQRAAPDAMPDDASQSADVGELHFVQIPPMGDNGPLMPETQVAASPSGSPAAAGPEHLVEIAYRLHEMQRPSAATMPAAEADEPTGITAPEPTVLLLHGSPGSHRDFRHITPQLRLHARVLEVDLPGFGASTRDVPNYSIRTHAHYVRALLEMLNIDRVHALGFSMGSGVALNLAEIAPEHFSSIIMYGGIGLQEAEGTGDYTFEHLKYRLGYAAIVLLPELIPHFGVLGDRDFRGPFIRNFMDTDQRPLKQVMQDLQIPTLIVHGEEDFFVPAWGAQAHHALIDRSRLIMFADEGHFMLFRSATSQVLADVVLPFLNELEHDGATGINRWSITFNDVPAVTATGPADAEGQTDDASNADAPMALSDDEIAARVRLASMTTTGAASDARPGIDEVTPSDQLPAILAALDDDFIITQLDVNAKALASGNDNDDAGAGKDDLPTRLNIERGMSPWLQMGTIAVGTFVSEDLTCITAGMLVRRQHIALSVAMLGCMLGIFIGDIGLWAIGRIFGRRLLAWPFIGQRIPVRRLERLGGFIDEHVGKAVILSRFLPGTRLPMYLAAGMLGRKSWQFLTWFAIAVIFWVPLVLALVIVVGEAAVAWLEQFFGTGWISLVLGVLLIFILLRTLELATTSIGRARIIARVSRLWRWEFWPSWLVYLPIIPWIAWLSLRHRGFNTITAANPAFPDGGFVGESKFDILSRLPGEGVARCGLIVSSDSTEDRLADFEEQRNALSLEFPVVLKPDVGERGAAVRLIRTPGEASAYLRDHPEPTLIQAYHPGPCEAGIFYVRRPGETYGQIFSITHKVFSFVEGDGESTLETLIWHHPRYRMQARTFLRRHAARIDDVLEPGERFRLAFAGNHCQGTRFCDGEHLWSPELESRIDAIMQRVPGFFYGRADIRYTSVDALQRGEGFAIIELNGVTSESTNIYDPDRGLIAAWRTIGKKCRLLFEIGSENRRSGIPATPHRTLVRRIYRHLFLRDADPMSD